jgi:hypothetical protein
MESKVALLCSEGLVIGSCPEQFESDSQFHTLWTKHSPFQKEKKKMKEERLHAF